MELSRSPRQNIANYGEDGICTENRLFGALVAKIRQPNSEKNTLMKLCDYKRGVI